MGPTASGKTDLAIRLVQSLPVEIISVDSVMVYRGMDIGSAKPDAETLRQAPHHLIDILDPAQAYSAASFREDALRELTGQATKRAVTAGADEASIRTVDIEETSIPYMDEAATRLRVKVVGEIASR